MTENGEEKKIQPGMTVRDLVVFLRLSDGAVTVERNGDVVTRATHPTTSHVEGDVIEIVRFAGRRLGEQASLRR